MSDTTLTIRPGAAAVLHIAIRLADGTMALSTFGEEPLSIRIGDGTLVPELERLLHGLAAGSEVQFLADGSDLYGPRDPDRIHWLEAGDLPFGVVLAPGEVVAFDTPGGQETAGIVLEATEQGVQVDFNHPLSGRSLQIRVQVLEVTPPAA